ncbi:MAG: response regulator transcription factor [Alphaproteobacteria bacterium]|nr:response regulator transcription factor [Alphaproteobacteria bacterium]MBF0393753.1 response regulator transcription factor [Alphaproteobacteria bacterium]
MTPTIFVVDDDDAMRHSLEFLLKSLGQPVACFASAEAFLAAWNPDAPGCLVLDVRMPGMSGLDLQRELNERAATLSIVFISGHGDIPMVVRAMRAGAMDFLEKPFNDQVLLDHVTAGLRKSAKACEAARRAAALRARIDGLTARERAVMGLVALGKPNKVIAFELDISIKTVEVHRAHVMEKMGATSVADLTRMLVEAGS